MVEDTQAKPEVVVGWVVASEVTDSAVAHAIDAARKETLSLLESQFPDYGWRMPLVERRVFPPLGALDVMPLLELGVLEKTHQGWDYALVVVPNELSPRHRAYTMAVPSSALEVGALSTARLHAGPGRVDELVALAVHVWGHLAGLGHRESGPMRPPNDAADLTPERFSPDEAGRLRRRLAEVADVRLEDQDRRWSAIRFYWRAFVDDPRAVVQDVAAYKPWLMPLYLGRLTAAAAVSTVFLLLTSDAWQVGVAIPAAAVWASTVLAVLVSTVFVFLGQNVGHVGRDAGWSEQTVRSRIVMFSTLLVGMTSLWLVLLVIALAATALVPSSVAADWTGLTQGQIPLARYSAFVATIGVLAASLGGNLEEEAELKAELLFDEET